MEHDHEITITLSDDFNEEDCGTVRYKHTHDDGDSEHTHPWVGGWENAINGESLVDDSQDKMVKASF